MYEKEKETLSQRNPAAPKSHMEGNQKTRLLLLLLQISVMKCAECPPHPDQNLSCFNDFNQNITCDWRSPLDRGDSMCTLYAEEISDLPDLYSSSCDLKPVDISTPTLMRCSLIFNLPYIFFVDDSVSLKVSCGTEKDIVNISYKISCHIKINPGKPVVNHTTISWFLDHEELENWSYELQWKLRDQPWSGAAELKQADLKAKTFQEELDQEWLIQGENYEARVRMKASDFTGPWSDWSPAVSWVSPVGRPRQPSDVAQSIWQMVVAGMAVVLLLVVVAFLRLDKTTWIYIVKKIRGPPLPSPASSSLHDLTFQSWLHPYFAKDLCHSFLRTVEIVSVEITSAVDGVSPRRPETGMRRDVSIFESSGSSFANPSYSTLCRPSLVFPPAAGGLEACVLDAPHGPAGGAGAQQQGGKVREEKMDIVKLFCRENSSGESAVEVVLDYEKVEKLQFERLRLPSLDSGVCSVEEVSQESLEADSITGHEEDLEKEWVIDRGCGTKVDFQKLLKSGKGSILVCSDYEAVENLSCSRPGLTSSDSSPSKTGEEPEDKPSESTPLLFPPCYIHPHPPLAFSSSSPCPSLMSAGWSVEPSGDDYVPLQQEQI